MATSPDTSIPVPSSFKELAENYRGLTHRNAFLEQQVDELQSANADLRRELNRAQESVRSLCDTYGCKPPDHMVRS